MAFQVVFVALERLVIGTRTFKSMEFQVVSGVLRNSIDGSWERLRIWSFKLSLLRGLGKSQ